MRRAPWKATERLNAAIIKGKRVPVSGRGRGDAPDIAHEFLSVEVKHRKLLPEWQKDAMRQAEAAGQGTDKLPIVILHEHGARHLDNLVMVRMSDAMGFFAALGYKEGEL